MKTIGIIGGIGPESTIAYYRLIILSFQNYEKRGNYPQIIINSINMKKMLDLIGENRLDDVTNFLVSEIHKLAKAGADFGVLASNTPHLVFNQIKPLSPLPLISIVEATCEKIKNIGIGRVGLFGTKFTMESGFYGDIFSAQGMEVILPDEKEQAYIHDKYMGELVKGIFKSETKKGLLKIATNLKKIHGIQGLILGGTELPLILKETDYNGLPFFDTTAIHVESIIKMLINDNAH